MTRIGDRPDRLVHHFENSMTIVAQQFNVRSEKILFLAMAMLRFAAKYPRKVGDNGIPVPWRTGFALFGPLTVTKTIRSLRGVWALPYGLEDDSLELSVFTRQYKQPGFWIPEDKQEEFGEMDEKEIYEWEQVSLMPNPELLAAWVGKLRSDELTPLELSFFFGNERKVWTAYELTREEFEGKLSRKTMEEIHADWIERSSSYY